MARDLHFSMDTIPERYRAQVEAQLNGCARSVCKPDDAVIRRGRVSSGNEATASRAVVSSHASAASPIRVGKSKKGPNGTERRFNAVVLGGVGKFEPVTFNLSGGKYTPDWMAADEETGVVRFYEVKGSYRLPSQGRSVFAFKQACAEYPMFEFVFAELEKGEKEWNVASFRGGERIGCLRIANRAVGGGGISLSEGD